MAQPNPNDSGTRIQSEHLSPMRRVFSTRLFVNQRLTTALLDRFARAGVLEIELHCALRHLDYRRRSQIDELKHWFRDSEMRVAALNAPVYSEESENQHSLIDVSHLEKAERIKATDQVRRAIEIADAIPFEYVVVQVGAVDDEYSQARSDAAFNGLDELHVFARQLDADLLVKNHPNALSTADRLELLLKMTHLPLGYCFDAGAAHLDQEAFSEFAKMRERVRMVQLHDNDGERDSRRAPLVEEGGTIDWQALSSELRTLPESTPFALDLDADPERENPLDVARESFDRLEELLADG